MYVRVNKSNFIRVFTRNKKFFGVHLQKVILYGSYARGDNNAHSDVDIMILVDFMENEIRERIDEVAELTFNIEIDYEVVLNG